MVQSIKTEISRLEICLRMSEMRFRGIRSNDMERNVFHKLRGISSRCIVDRNASVEGLPEKTILVARGKNPKNDFDFEKTTGKLIVTFPI